MSFFARVSIYKIGRISILFALGLVSVSARAQDAAPTPQPPDAGSPEATPAPAAPAPLPVVPAPAPAPDPALQGRVDALELRTKLLETNLAAAQAAASSPRSTTTFQTDEGGFAITSADRNYQIRFKGLLQVDGRRAFDDAALATTEDTFITRRVRPIVAGTVLGLTDFYIAPDFGNNTIVLIDGYLDTHPFPWLRLRAGKFKGPVGLERLQADQDVTFVERALTQNLSTQREVGLEIWGDIAGGIARYEAGYVNGNPDNGINDIDSNKSKTFVGRLFFQPFNIPSLRPLGKLGVGVAASSGIEQGSATNSWVGAFKSFGQNTIFSYLTATTPTTVFASGRHTRLNPQLYYYLGPFGLLAEWVHEYQQLANSAGPGSVNNSAGNVEAAFVIGGDETYEGVKPHKSLDLADGGYGALEIGLTYNWLEVDHAAFPTAADPTRSVNRARAGGIALNWQLSRNLRASGDFTETRFEGGAKGTANRNTEKVGIARFQIAF
jgi:phosphate-selective porin OprO/OprP